MPLNIRIFRWIVAAESCAAARELSPSFSLCPFSTFFVYCFISFSFPRLSFSFSLFIRSFSPFHYPFHPLVCFSHCLSFSLTHCLLSLSVMDDQGLCLVVVGGIKLRLNRLIPFSTKKSQDVDCCWWDTTWTVGPQTDNYVSCIEFFPPWESFWSIFYFLQRSLYGAKISSRHFNNAWNCTQENSCITEQEIPKVKWISQYI